MADDAPPPVPPGQDQGPEPERRADGRFPPGRSGNPTGRPLGTRARALASLDRRAGDAAASIIESLIGRAKNGDTEAARLLLARCWPQRRGHVIEVPGLAEAPDTAGAFTVVIEAVGNGTISAEEGEALARLLAARQQAVEVVALAERIAALEAEHGTAEGTHP